MIRPHPYFWRKVTVHVSLLVVCSAHNNKDAQNISSVTCFRLFFRILLEHDSLKTHQLGALNTSQLGALREDLGAGGSGMEPA
jgi:hypothetical protein